VSESSSFSDSVFSFIGNLGWKDLYKKINPEG
jgi:hypothetical protein